MTSCPGAVGFARRHRLDALAVGVGLAVTLGLGSADRAVAPLGGVPQPLRLLALVATSLVATIPLVTRWSVVERQAVRGGVVTRAVLAGCVLAAVLVVALTFPGGVGVALAWTGTLTGVGAALARRWHEGTWAVTGALGLVLFLLGGRPDDEGRLWLDELVARPEAALTGVGVLLAGLAWFVLRQQHRAPLRPPGRRAPSSGRRAGRAARPGRRPARRPRARRSRRTRTGTAGS